MPSFADIYLYLHKLIKYIHTHSTDTTTIEVDCAKYMRIRVWMWNTWWFSSSKQNIIISNSHTSFACKFVAFFLSFLQKKKNNNLLSMKYVRKPTRPGI